MGLKKELRFDKIARKTVGRSGPKLLHGDMES